MAKPLPAGFIIPARYAIVNDRPVIVEPRSRRIVEIIE
jgi:hypothetical protein